MAASTRNTATAIVLSVLVLAGCNAIYGFDQPLVMPDFRDADEEVTFFCESNEDCTALGPCIVCTMGACQEAANADGDGDGYLNIDCDGEKKGDDCDDTDADVHPDAEERCNGADDNCDGTRDEGDAFGLSWTTGRSGGHSGVPAPVTGRTGLAWVEGSSPCSSIVSAFVDIGGAIRYPTTIAECGEDVYMAERGSSVGFAAAWVDRSLGGANVFLQLLDPSGDPDASYRDPVNVSDDYEESDMPVLAWSPTGYHFAVAWLSHDTDDRNSVRVLFDLLEPNGTALLPEARPLTSAYFRLDGDNDLTFGEKVDLVSVDGETFEGFAVAWAQSNGIWIATVDVSEDGTAIDDVQTLNLAGTTATSGAFLPSLAWADERFVVAYAQVNPDGTKPSPDVRLAQVFVEGGTLRAEPITFDYLFPREATYPAVVYHADLDEIGLAWADGREGYGKREVRFARLKLEQFDGATHALFVLEREDLVLTEPEAYAAGVDLGFEPGGGFVATWTERSESGVSLQVGYLECRQ
jgi:hypothetical protein